jgi:CBS domain-containing protein
MFSIYGVAGRVFSGPLEQLRRVRPVGSAGRVEPLGDAEGGFSAALSAANAGAGGGGAASAPAGGLAAYREAARGDRQPVQSIAQLISRPAFTLPEAMPAREAWQRLADRGVSQAPVLGPDGRLVGLIGRAGLAPGPGVTDVAAHWQGAVARLMRTPVPAVQAEASPRQAAQALLVTGLPGLPVVDGDGQVMGFLSRTDLLRGIAQDPPLDIWA